MVNLSLLVTFYHILAHFAKIYTKILPRKQRTMGTLQKSTYTIPIPKNATVKNGIASWTSKDKKKTGKLSGKNKVLCQSEIWIAHFIDENGKLQRISTKTSDKVAAGRILAKYENEVSLIQAGLATRTDIIKTASATTPIQEFLDKFKVKLVAEGNSQRYIEFAISRIDAIIKTCKFETLQDISRNSINQWIADEIKKGARTASTINTYVVAISGFLNWCIESKYLTENPLAKLKKLNEAVGRKKQRRSLTENELTRLLTAARSRKYRKADKGEEHKLIYRLLVGTGLRSMELGNAKPFQFDFEKCRFTVKAEATKNRKDDVLPVRADLCKRLKAWIEKRNIQPHERIFFYTKKSIHSAFKIDCRVAGIELKSADGRSIDVHALRRTFGTMLARAGVPLTTTQRLMRHSTPELTAKLYIDVEPVDMQQAVDKLPTF